MLFILVSQRPTAKWCAEIVHAKSKVELGSQKLRLVGGKGKGGSLHVGKHANTPVPNSKQFCFSKLKSTVLFSHYKK